MGNGDCQEDGAETGRDAVFWAAMCAFIWRHMSCIWRLGSKGPGLDGGLAVVWVGALRSEGGGVDLAGRAGSTDRT
jgi:hypothetical protein